MTGYVNGFPGSNEDAREFWERHSLANFAGEIEEAREVQFVKRNNLIVSLDLEKEDMKRLRLLARKKGIKYTDLITLWIKEHLSKL